MAVNWAEFIEEHRAKQRERRAEVMARPVPLKRVRAKIDFVACGADKPLRYTYALKLGSKWKGPCDKVDGRLMVRSWPSRADTISAANTRHKNLEWLN